MADDAWRNRSRGFTLIEILVTTAILVLMATVAIPATRSTERKVRLRQAAATVSSYIGEARTLALAPQTGPITVTGYGIELSQTNRSVTLLELRGNSPARTIRFETLPAEVTVNSLTIGSNTATSVTISFSIGDRLEISPNQPVSLKLMSAGFNREITFSPATGFAEVR